MADRAHGRRYRGAGKRRAGETAKAHIRSVGRGVVTRTRICDRRKKAAPPCRVAAMLRRVVWTAPRSRLLDSVPRRGSPSPSGVCWELSAKELT